MTLTNIGKGPDAWRNHGMKSPLPACNFQVGDLKKLYHILEKRQIEYRDFFSRTYWRSNQTKLMNNSQHAIIEFLTRLLPL